HGNIVKLKSLGQIDIDNRRNKPSNKRHYNCTHDIEDPRRPKWRQILGEGIGHPHFDRLAAGSQELACASSRAGVKIALQALRELVNIDVTSGASISSILRKWRAAHDLG